jgi:hypothetical protein
MDGDLGKSIIVGISTGMTTLAILPMLFKGQLMFKRESDALKDHCDSIVSLKDKEIDRLQGGLEDAQHQLKEQYLVNTDLTKQVFSTVQFLQSLAGTASQDRRRRADAGRPGD